MKTLNTQHSRKKIKKNSESGMISAEFLFSFILVIGCGIVIFAFTFSLMTIEVAQYITWSSARVYASSFVSQGQGEAAARTKYKNLINMFPLLTGGNNADSIWLKMSTDSEIIVGNLSSQLTDARDDNASASGEPRHPWTGVQATIDMVLFKGIKIPFLGPITQSPDDFSFPLRSMLLRHPSQVECQTFYSNRFSQGISKLNDESSDFKSIGTSSQYFPIEDNGC